MPAPPILEFDAAGKLVSSWGGPSQGYQWPQVPGGIAVDTKGNVWITAAGLEPPPPAAGPRAEARAATGAPPRLRNWASRPRAPLVAPPAGTATPARGAARRRCRRLVERRRRGTAPAPPYRPTRTS